MNQPADLKHQRRAVLRAHDRLLPYSAECEQGVLSCEFQCPQECVPECIGFFGAAGHEVFYDLRHQEIQKAFVEMHALKMLIDVISVQQYLKDKQMLEQVGGFVYLSALMDISPSAANLSYYAEFVLDKYIARKLILTCTDVVGRVYEFEGEINQLVDEVERDILQVRPHRQADDVPISTLVQQAIVEIENCHALKGMVSGIATGFSDFDKVTSGLQNQDMIVIAARPSMGKTSLACNIVEHVAVDLGLPVGVFSLEMSSRSLTQRLLCSRARVNMRNVREGFLAERDFPKITNAAGKIAKAPIYINDTGGMSIMQVRAKARRWSQEHKIKLIVIDYLQLMNAQGAGKYESRQQEVALISGGIKNMAKELNVPVIVLSQLSREVDKQKRRPVMADLRESGAIEQDSDLIGFLFKEQRGDSDDDFDHEQEAVAITLGIAKQRNGPTCDIDLMFIKPYTRFESAAKVSDEDIPGQETMAYGK